MGGSLARLLILAVIAVLGVTRSTVAQPPTQAQIHANITKAITSHPVGTTLVQSGEQFTYTITFSVSGSTSASGVVVTDIVPPELQVLSVLAGAYSYTVSPFNASTGTTVAINCGTMTAGSAGQVQINVQFWTGRTCAGTEACNQASISSPDFDTVKTEKACMIAIAKNKFTIEKTAVAILPDQVVRWRICVTNPAGSNLGGYNLTWPTFYDTFPTGAQVVAVTDLNGTPISGANLASGTWSSGTFVVNPGLYQVCYLIDIKYPSPTWGPGDVVKNCVRMDAGHACQEDSLIRLTSCDTATLAKVVAVPGMQGAKYLSLGANGAGPFTPGCTGTYSIWYKNTGNTTLGPVEIEDNIPHEIEVSTIYTAIPAQCSLFEYQKNGVNVWYSHSVGTTPLTVHGAGPNSLGLTLGMDYISRVRWTYSSISSGQQIAYNSFSFTILQSKFDDPNDLTTPGDLITNTATADAPGLNTITMVNNKTVDPFAPRITLAKYVVGTCSGFVGPYLPGHTARYRLVVGNYGSADATAFNVTDVLPSHLTYAGNEKYYYVNGPWLSYTSITPCSPSSTSMPFTITPGAGNLTGASTVGWSVSGLPHNCGGSVAYMVIEFDIKISSAPPAPALSYWNHFTVGSGQLGTLTSPDAQLIVNAVTSITTEKQVRVLPNGTFGSSATVEPGSLVEYRLRIKNTGNQTVDNLRLMDILPHPGDPYVVNVTVGRGSTAQMLLSSAPIASSGSPTTEYQSVSNVCRIPFLPIAADITGCDGTLWSAPFAGSKAFRMDFGNWQLVPGTTLDVTFQATASTIDSTIACNSFGVVGRTVANGQTFPPLEPAPVCINVIASCTELIGKKISCRMDDRGAIVYDYCFSVRNNSQRPLYHFDPDITAPSGLTLTPGSLSFWGNPIPPNGVSGPYCFTISGPNAQAGTWVHYITTASLYDSLLGCVKCDVADSIKLPDCPLPDTCCTFSKLSFSLPRISALVDGTTSISGLTFAGAGSMQSVSVSLVNCYLNGQPVVGQMTGGTLAGSAGAVQSMHELRFGQWLPCKDFQNGQGFAFNMKFPPYSDPCARERFFRLGCPDLLTFCLRVRFIDCKCCQRDTLICFETRRAPVIIWYNSDIANLLRRGITEKDDAPETQSVSVKDPLIGTLIGSDSGTLQVNFPKPDSVTVRFVGMKIRSSDSAVTIDNAVGDNGSLFVATDGTAFGYFTASPGDQLNIGLKYNDIGDRTSLEHIVTMIYTVDGETVEEDVPVVFRREGTAGGDLLEETKASVRDVRTFALHLRNTNGSAEPIDRIVLRTDSGVNIVGVGPTRNDSVAVLTLGRNGDRTVVGEDIAEIRTELLPGETYEPIYLTVSGFTGEPVTVDFMTLNSDGATVSEGTLTLSDPISGIRLDDGGPTTGTWGVLSQSYPNPTDRTATIEFVLSRSESNVELAVSDQSGREVARLIDHESLGSGAHVVWFDGSGLPSGTYFYTLRTDAGAETKTLRIVK